MPERFPLPEHKDDSDKDSDSEKPRDKKTRRYWKAPIPFVPEESRETSKEKPPVYKFAVPPSQEVSVHAVAEAARQAAELAFKKDDEEEEPEASEHKEEKETTADQTETMDTSETAAADSPEQAEIADDTEALKQIAREENQSMEGEQTEASPAVEEYLEHLAEDGDLERAEEDAISHNELKQLQAEIDEMLELEAEHQALLSEAADRLETDEPTDDELIQAAEEVLNEQASHSGLDTTEMVNFASDEHDPDLLFSPPATAAARTPAPAPPVTSSGSPPPPSPPGGGGGGGGPGGGPAGSPLPPPGAGPNVLTGPVGPAMREMGTGMSAAERAMWRRKVWTVGLLAGVLGYYIGKGKGRRQQAAKTEPVIEKQEKQNADLHQKVADGQRRIRSLETIKQEQAKAMRERENRQQETITEPVNESIAIPAGVPKTEKQKLKPPFKLSPVESAVPVAAAALAYSPERPPVQAEQPAIISPEVPLEAKPENPEQPQPSPETPLPQPALVQEQNVNRRPEITPPSYEIAEEAAPALPEVSAVAPVSPEIPATYSVSELNERAPESPLPKPVEESESNVMSMNLPELLTVAKEMTVGGTNLEQLYHDKQIDAEGLKRVVAEYYRGGNPEQILASERNKMELRRQTPEFLHGQPAGSASAGGGGSPGGGISTQGAPAGLFAQSAQTSSHMLPAYDHEQYPSNTPQHLLPEYDQETEAKRRRNTVVVAVAAAGLFVGATAAAILLL